MASITNRSAFTVTVPGYRGKDKNKYTRTFVYSKLKDAEAYMRALIEQGLTPDIAQSEDTFQVKVIRKGYRDQIKTFKSLAEAETFVKRIESEEEQGLFRNYTQAAKTTTADLIRKYMDEDCPSMKGGDNYIIILRAMLEDSSHELRKRVAQRKAEIKEFGKALTPLGANRQPMTSLEWLHLPLTQVTPATSKTSSRTAWITWSAQRSTDKSTSCRPSTPGHGQAGASTWTCRRSMESSTPKYFNERDRRLKGDEELRLLEAARKEDQMASMEAHVEALAADEVAAARKLDTHYAVNKARKEAYERARRKAVEEGFPHVPRMEVFLLFQLATAARRGETLGLFWDRLDWDEKTAFIPTSKNGRPRKLSVRSDILALLQQLPRTSDLVFDISLKELLAAWNRICEAAGVEDLRIHDLRHEGISRAAVLEVAQGSIATRVAPEVESLDEVMHQFVAHHDQFLNLGSDLGEPLRSHGHAVADGHGDAVGRDLVLWEQLALESVRYRVALEEGLDQRTRVLSDTFSKFAARWASSVSAGPASSWWASSVFISRSYCCNRSMHRPSQRWTSSWPWGLGWSVIASVFHGGSTGPGGPLQPQPKFRRIRNSIWHLIESSSVSDLPKF